VTEIVFKSPREWLDAMIAHQCGREKMMIPSDNPLKGQFGFVCVGCDTYFLTNLTSLKMSFAELSAEERKMISTRDGRLSMTWYLGGTVVQVRADWSRRYTTALFFFHDEAGNFRMSLIESNEKRFRRFTFFVEQDDTGAKNRTFRYRMTNAASNDKAARGEVAKWNSYQDINAAFSVEALNKEFYRELSNWYFWALDRVEFPEAPGDRKEGETDAEARQRRNATSLIRLITRLMFVWFMKEKGLIPQDLFDKDRIEEMLNLEDPTGSTYYKAVLQNLFFATLNTEMGKDRRFVEDEREWQGKQNGHGIQYFYRYKRYLRDPKAFLELMRDIPFLNGGLFTCLDVIEYNEQGKKTKEVRIDVFSTQPKNAKLVAVPDTLFWHGTCTDQKTKEPSKTFDLSGITGKKETVGVYGLIPLLQRYNFTVDESSKDDETVALDPELLGRVFENLLASYNPETSTTARKATGSFYTPREIVNYMVEESLAQHLRTALKVEDEAAETALRRLVADGEADENLFTAKRNAETVQALKTCKILDPACGSGAFPMGILQAMLRALEALDPIGDDDTKLYQRKLDLIENCIYGVDIQPIAVQISKLRCFISLLAEDKEDEGDANRGIETLPNLEMHFVAANSLIGVERSGGAAPGAKGNGKRKAQSGQMELGDADSEITRLKQELADLRHRWMTTRSSTAKKTLPEKFIGKQKELADALTRNQWYGQEQANTLVTWNPFDQNSASDFFDIEWMFGIKDGVDVVIGNPPYVRADEQSEWNQAQRKAIMASKAYKTLWEKWDLFVPFIERGYKLLRPGGVSTMIVSDAFCHAKYAQKPQNWFLQNARILRLDFCADLKIFDAAVHNLVYFFQKADGTRHKPERRLHKEEFGNVTALPTDEQAKLTYRAFFPEESTSRSGLVGTPVADICYVSYGLRPNSDEDEAKGEFATADVVSDRRDRIHSKPYVEGKHLAAWLPATNQWIEWGTSRAPAQFCRPTFPELYTVPEKIIAQRSPGPDPVVSYDDANLVFTPASVGFVPWHMLSGVRNNSLKKAARYKSEKPPRPDLPQREALEKTSRRFAVKYLLAVMNSSVARDFLRAHRRSNIHLYPDDWKKLPVPDVDAKAQAPIIELVDRILAARRADPRADIAALEKQVDGVVAGLYGLTPDEVAHIEAATDGATEGAGSAAAPPAETAPKRRGRKPRQETGLDL
jgi:hypothetical protein